MAIRLKKGLAVAAVGLLLTADGILLVKHLRMWEEVGATGIIFITPGSVSARGLVSSVPNGLLDGQVFLIAPESPASRAGLRRTDRILDVSGIPLSDPKGMLELSGRLRSGDTVVYRVQSGKEERFVPVRIENPTRRAPVMYAVFSGGLVALSFLLIGFVTIWKRPNDPRTLLFFLMSAAAALFFSGGLLVEGDVGLSIGTLRVLFQDPRVATLCLTVLAAGTAGFVLFLVLLMHFALLFPQRSRLLSNRPHLIGWVYVPPLLLASTIAARLLFYQGRGVPFLAIIVPILGLTLLLFPRWLKRLRREGWRRAVLARPMQTTLALILLQVLAVGGRRLLGLAGAPTVICKTAFILHMTIPLTLSSFSILLYPLAICLVSLRNYYDAGPEARRQARWPLWAMIIATTAVILEGILDLLIPGTYGVAEMLLSFASTSLWLLVPLSFAFAILKYRLMEIDIVIRKTVLYAVLTGIIVFLYLLLAGGIGGLLVRYAGVENTWVTVAATLAVAALILPIRNRLQRFLNRRLFRKPLDYPSALQQLRTAALQAIDMPAFLQETSETIQRALESRSVVALARKSPRLPFLPCAGLGLPDHLVSALRIPEDSPLASATPGQSHILPERLPEAEKAMLGKAGIAMLVPAGMQDQQAYLICLGRKLSGDEFNEEDRGFLTEVAAQIDTASGRIRLHQDQLELDRARDIQLRLMPTEILPVEGYEMAASWRPSKTVAGDYYDVLKISETEVGLCIADVVGKGMPAALLMSNLQAAVNALAPSTLSPRELCEKLNAVVHRNAGLGRFITFFYARLAGAERKLTFTNAGHNAPILLHRDRSLDRLEDGGLVLGAFAGTGYVEREVTLCPGDRLVLFTDGIVEVRDANGDEFGEERLLELLRDRSDLGAQALVDEILDAVVRFGRGNLEDDATLLVVTAQ